MSLYRPNRLPHEIMKLLDRSPKTLRELVEGLNMRNPVKGPIKVRYIVEAMQRDRFIQIYDGVHGLTKAGRETLQDLNDGINVRIGDEAMPTVRIF